MYSMRKRDKQIIEFINTFGYIDINQCSKIFYTNHKMGYDEARKRLKLMFDNGKLQKLKIGYNKIIYTFEKEINYHRYYLIEFYSLLCKYSKIKFFNKEMEFKDLHIRPDGFCELIYNNQLISMFIEIDYTHKTQLDRYERLYEDGRIQRYYQEHYSTEIFPTVVIISEKVGKKLVESDNFNIIYLDFSFNNFERVLI